jgi:hypothetical protein
MHCLLWQHFNQSSVHFQTEMWQDLWGPQPAVWQSLVEAWQEGCPGGRHSPWNYPACKMTEVVQNLEYSPMDLSMAELRPLWRKVARQTSGRAWFGFIGTGSRLGFGRSKPMALSWCSLAITELCLRFSGAGCSRPSPALGCYSL